MKTARPDLTKPYSSVRTNRLTTNGVKVQFSSPPSHNCHLKSMLQITQGEQPRSLASEREEHVVC